MKTTEKTKLVEGEEMHPGQGRLGHTGRSQYIQARATTRVSRLIFEGDQV